jgi:hypothetical protein
MRWNPVTIDAAPPVLNMNDKAMWVLGFNEALETIRAAQPEKYDDVLRPFLALMRKELHTNCGKGDRPGWLAMSPEVALLEVYYHLAKLQKAVRKNDGPAIQEYSADVANMSMMVLDICGGLAWVEEPAIAQEDHLDADIARLMALPEAEVDAELRSMGMDPADAARRGQNAVQKALAIFHITRAEVHLQADALHLVRDHLKAAREALRSKPSGVAEGRHQTLSDQSPMTAPPQHPEKPA